MQAERILHPLRRFLEHRHLPAFLAIVGLTITLAALGTGLLNDDLCHRAELTGPSRANERLSDVGLPPNRSGDLSEVVSDLFIAVRPDYNLEKLKAYGALPWWTYDHLRVSFWRPISAFTHWLDYRLFPNSVILMHAHNLLWFAAAIFLVAILYRRLMVCSWVAGLASLLYLLDDSSYFPAMWIANRNIFLSLFFGILTLLAHHRWRQHHSVSAAIVAPLCLLGSLLSAEAGVATFAYLFAYAVALDRGSRLRRAISLAPAILLIVLWRIIYSALGHGAYGGNFYLDPAREPLRYAWAVITRGPVLLMGQWSCIPADIFNFIPDSAKAQYLPIIIVFVVLVLIVLLPLVCKDRLARLWLIGMYLSVVPVCATVPMSRNLLFVAIGAFGLMAQFIGGLVTRQDWLPVSRLWRGAAWTLCILLLIVHLPMAAIVRISTPIMTSFLVKNVQSTMEIGSPKGFEDQDLVVVNAPNPSAFIYMPFLRAYEGQPLPRAIRVLAPGFGPLEIIRSDDNDVVLRARGGNLLAFQEQNSQDSIDFAYFYRSVSDVRGARHPLKLGDRAELPRMSVEVIAVDGSGVPTEVLFKFAASLEDGSLRWLQWDWEKGRYVPFKVPAVGQAVQISGPF